MNMTIKTVQGAAREWQGPNGTMFFVQCYFTDGSSGSLGAKSKEKAEEYIQALTELVGKEGDFELEFKKDGPHGKEWKVKNYPGKPQSNFGGGGGKSNYTPRFSDTEEGWLATQRSIYRSVALQQAIQYWDQRDNPTEIEVLSSAELFNGWLCEGLPTPSKPQGLPAHGGEGQNATETSPAPSSAKQALRDGYESGQAGPLAKTVNTGATCESCGAPSGKLHATGCGAEA